MPKKFRTARGGRISPGNEMRLSMFLVAALKEQARRGDNASQFLSPGWPKRSYAIRDGPFHTVEKNQAAQHGQEYYGDGDVHGRTRGPAVAGKAPAKAVDHPSHGI